MTYDFVFYDNNWHLKIDDIEQLFNYSEKLSDAWVAALFRTGDSPKKEIGITDKKAAYIQMFAEAREISYLDAIQQILRNTTSTQIDLINAGKTLLFNSAGGYQYTNNDIIFDNYTSNQYPVFPHFTADDIRVKQFPNGDHFYAYIGDIWVKNGDIVKYDTHQDAHAAAAKLIAKN